jgi:methylmalonyl-CoA mutase N-terminal domain/subunit
VEKGEVAVVGVNKFAAGAEAEPEMELQKGSPQAAREAAERVRHVKRERNGEAARKALDRLSQAAGEKSNLQPSIREAVAAYCTVGEIAAVLKEKFGAYQPPTKF